MSSEKPMNDKEYNEKIKALDSELKENERIEAGKREAMQARAVKEQEAAQEKEEKIAEKRREVLKEFN